MYKNIFEINDLSNIQLEKINGIDIWYMDNFYKYPEDLCQYISYHESKLWKENEPGSYNSIYFEDRRHFIVDERFERVSRSIANIIKKEPLNPNFILTNLIRFTDHPFNDYKNNFWHPHQDTGHNAIIYLNKEIECQNSGTNIYNKLNNNFITSGEHSNPWCPKIDWEVVIGIRAVFNRLVIFDGKHYHAMNISDKNFFGNTLNEAKFRINQVIFFD